MTDNKILQIINKKPKKYNKLLLNIIIFLIILIAVRSYAQSKAEIIQYANKVSVKYDIPDLILPAIIQVESSFDINAISYKKAIGLMQITTNAFKDYKKYNKNNIKHFTDIKTNWQNNILVGAWYLKYCYNNKHDWQSAITAYFWGMSHTNCTDKYYKKVMFYKKKRKTLDK